MPKLKTKIIEEKLQNIGHCYPCLKDRNEQVDAQSIHIEWEVDKNGKRIRIIAISKGYLCDDACCVERDQNMVRIVSPDIEK